MGADGLSGSLERISPETSAKRLPTGLPRRSQRTASSRRHAGQSERQFFRQSPARDLEREFTPEDPSPGQPITVETDVRDSDGVAK